MTCKRALIDTNKLIREGAIGGLRTLIIAGFGNITDKIYVIKYTLIIRNFSIKYLCIINCRKL